MPSTSSGIASAGGTRPQNTGRASPGPVPTGRSVALPAAPGLHARRTRHAAACCASQALAAHRRRRRGTGRRARHASVRSRQAEPQALAGARAGRWTRAAAARRPGVAAQSAPVTARTRRPRRTAARRERPAPRSPPRFRSLPSKKVAAGQRQADPWRRRCRRPSAGRRSGRDPARWPAARLRGSRSSDHLRRP